jgi:hypothetical protein
MPECTLLISKIQGLVKIKLSWCSFSFAEQEIAWNFLNFSSWPSSLPILDLASKDGRAVVIPNLLRKLALELKCDEMLYVTETKFHVC